MDVNRLDPLADRRWSDFLERAPGASVFHSAQWLGALKQAYDYEPVVYTTSGPGQPLTDGVAFCRVSSWITGKRLVSIPFADHCEPLVADPEALDAILATVREDVDSGGLKYFELRSRTPLAKEPIERGRMGRSSEFAFHAIDLSPTEDELYAQLHNTSIRQRIRRAAREELEVERGRDERLVDEFYQLLLGTRRKHQVPPQPRYWFRILAEKLGEGITFHNARYRGKPIASIVTLNYRDAVVHKYGCSDQAEAKRCGTQLLLWESIKAARADGAREFDMGRSDLANEGLISFKTRWGGNQVGLEYYRFPAPTGVDEPEGWKARMAKKAFSRMPDSMLRLAGRILYKHVG